MHELPAQSFKLTLFKLQHNTNTRPARSKGELTGSLNYRSRSYYETNVLDKVKETEFLMAYLSL